MFTTFVYILKISTRGFSLEKCDRMTYIGQTVLASEFPLDITMFIRAFFVTGIDDNTVIFGLDVDLFGLELLNVNSHSKLAFVVD